MPDPKPKAAKANSSKPPKDSPAATKPSEPTNDATPKDKLVRPEKPDDDAYKTILAAAEKELEAAKARLVCRYPAIGHAV
jgi:hypothetical protein